MSRSKRQISEPPKGGLLAQQFHLVQSLIFLFLMSDIGSYHFFIMPYSGYKISTRPEMLTNKVSSSFSVNSRYIDRTFTLDESNHLKNSLFRRNADQHVNMIHHQMPFLYSALLLFRQLVKHLPQVRLWLAIQHLPSTLRDKHHMVLTLPPRVT